MNRKYNSIGEFIRDMEKGVFNFTKNGECSSCGSCCSALLPMTHEELKALRYYVKKMKIRPVVSALRSTMDLSCPFRDEERKICLVYNVRPLICRDFRCDKTQSGARNPVFQKKTYEIINLREIIF